LFLGSDRELPQVLRMRDLLKCGIGVHHGGLLPIIKEVLFLFYFKVFLIITIIN
jgi:antiviral helicase SKI2